MARIVVVGSLNMDLVAVAPRLPHAGETLIGSQFVTEPGGKGANQAYAAAKLNGDVLMLGRVGSDEYGERMRTNLAKAGCDISGVGTSDGSSGVAVIIVSESGQNSIVVVSGANHRYSEGDLQADSHHLRTAQLLLLQLETPVATVIAAAAQAKQGSAQVILDPAPAPSGALPSELLRCVDILTPNETEAVQLLGKPVSTLTDPEAFDIATQLQSFGVNAVILKLGARGCLLKDESTHLWLPAPSVRAVDSTAAGDVFNGALAVAVSEGASLDAACRFAVEASALSVTRLGAQRSMPSREELSGQT